MNSFQPSPDVRRPLQQDVEAEKAEQKKKWHQRLSRLFGRDYASAMRRQESPAAISTGASVISNAAAAAVPESDPLGKPRAAGLRFPRQVIPGLPRPGTFKRQLSERRERLSPSHVDHLERRTLSVDSRRPQPSRTISPAATATAFFGPRVSAPAVYEVPDSDASGRLPLDMMSQPLPQQPNMDAMLCRRPTEPPTPPPDEPPPLAEALTRRESTVSDMQTELEDRWILNLSMHFRDKSPREKFFVTYAETPNRWRRVTVSCDYRDALKDSLEADLRNLHYQRDKSARIYEAIRSSLPDIQFYETVTNLRLETSADERLHVHVTEDVNEIIPYPDALLLQHLDYSCFKRVPESQVHFLSHMSGFVYKVRVDDEILIKKEIPGPDSVEEFLYEINALHALLGSDHVVQMRGLVYDESQSLITGLLIDYYDQGPLVDILFDRRGQLSWERRNKWATQIIQGLGEIHEAGFVQGDFTVSNICIGGDDNARIIDINRRGCPVGWEPPEIANMIESGQRISMYIGVKSDLYQLGMVLWAIAMEDDEPERRQRPLRLPDDAALGVPGWYQEATHLCLKPSPKDRLSADRLLSLARQPSRLSLAPTRRNSSAALSSRPRHHDEVGVAAGVSNVATQGLATSHQNEPARTGIAEVRAYSRSTSSSSSGNGSRDASPIRLLGRTNLDDDDEGPRGRSPPRDGTNMTANWSWNRTRSYVRGSDGYLSSPSPEIVSIAPTGTDWREISFNGHDYFMHIDRSAHPTSPDPRQISQPLQRDFSGTAHIRHVSRSEASNAADASRQTHQTSRASDHEEEVDHTLDASRTSNLPEASESPRHQDLTEAPEVPEVPDIADASDMPEAPEVPEVPEVPETFEASQIPEMIRAPEASEVPRPFDLPEAPEAPPRSLDNFFAPSFYHVDSGLADMHLPSEEAPSSYASRMEELRRSNTSSSNLGDYNFTPRAFQHHDSGLGDMGMDIPVGFGGNEALQTTRSVHETAPCADLPAVGTGLPDVQEEPKIEEKYNSTDGDIKTLTQHTSGSEHRETSEPLRPNRDSID